MPRTSVWAVLLMLLGPPAMVGAIRHRSGRRVSTLSNRRRLHLQNLVSNPGTLEMEMGVAGSTNTIVSPFTLKYTPGAGGRFLQRTEFSVDLEPVNSVPGEDHWVTQFGDHVGLAAAHLLHQGKTLSVYIAPQVSFLTHANNGVRAGATVVAEADFGAFSLSGNTTWTGATSASDSNPAGDLQIGAGLIRRIGGTTDNARFTLFVNALQENPTVGLTTYSVFEGVSYQVRRPLAVDIAVRHLNLRGGQVDHQVLLGITVNLGRP